MVVKKNPAVTAGDSEDVGLVPGLGRSSGGGNGNPLQYSYWENLMGRGLQSMGFQRGWLDTRAYACAHTYKMVPSTSDANHRLAAALLTIRF